MTASLGSAFESFAIAMTPYLIIDGYNLMHAAGIARRSYAQGDMERCRSRLHRELASLLSRDVLSSALVVYDAFDSVTDENRQQTEHGLAILFAPRGTDADSQIERLLGEHSVPKRVIVVSGDHRLHKAARRRKARCVDSEEFWSSLSGHVIEPNQVKAPQASATTPVMSDDPVVESIHESADVEDLQNWLDELTNSDQTIVHEDAASSVFDADYLRKLHKDLNEGRLN